MAWSGQYPPQWFLAGWDDAAAGRPRRLIADIAPPGGGAVTTAWRRRADRFNAPKQGADIQTLLLTGAAAYVAGREGIGSSIFPGLGAQPAPAPAPSPAPAPIVIQAPAPSGPGLGTYAVAGVGAITLAGVVVYLIRR